MDMQRAIRAVTERRDLTAEEMAEVMRTVMTGGATPAQIGGFLIGLRMKGETVDEIAGAARVMRELATPVGINSEHLVDTCGTGGDGVCTFNISTASAFVAAAAGAKVAKHGNRSVSSRCGSADVLEAAGVNLDLGPAAVAQCVEEVGVGFMFAPRHHGAMKYAIGPRREMGVRTVFNVLGPLTNPAGAKNQVLGVYDRALLEPLAQVLQRLGSRHVLVVHAADGMDEISLSGETYIAELKDGAISTYSVRPADFELQAAPVEALTVADVQESLARVNAVLDNQPGPARDVVVLNAGAAIYAAGCAATLADGVARAQEVIASGAARAVLQGLVARSQALAGSDQPAASGA
ncbi:anthranilate phosphoribosyltransferase [Ectothiorhodospiraceae bacterium 2226]|nr:anthranilate phosphoribosyltransferase [Ectothiorhodospiraceae bacterium 2226]